MEQRVILVDENDNPLGTEEKMKAHQNGGKLHRALSVFVFNKNGETMLQQRAAIKYHTQNKWSNTCCSHQMEGEDTITAAHRRLKEEMGFDCPLKEAFNFTYHAEVGNGLKENEFDHIVFGTFDKVPRPNPDEVQDWKWISLPELKARIKSDPGSFTPWLRLMIDEVIKNYEKLSPGRKAS